MILWSFFFFSCCEDLVLINGIDFVCYIKENLEVKYFVCCKRIICYGRDVDFNFDEFIKFFKEKLYICYGK